MYVSSVYTHTYTRSLTQIQSLENAIAVVFALGGSTNAILHLLAIAHECQLPLSVHDFNRIGAKVPLLGAFVVWMDGKGRGQADTHSYINTHRWPEWTDRLTYIPPPPSLASHIHTHRPLTIQTNTGNLSPHGPYHMSDLDDIGGVPLVMKELLSAGLLHPDCLTVTGQTVAENLETVPTVGELPVEQDVLRPVARPLSPPGRHMVVLTGNLASESAVIKLSGKVNALIDGCVVYTYGHDMTGLTGGGPRGLAFSFGSSKLGY